MFRASEFLGCHEDKCKILTPESGNQTNFLRALILGPLLLNALVFGALSLSVLVLCSLILCSLVLWFFGPECFGPLVLGFSILVPFVFFVLWSLDLNPSSFASWSWSGLKTNLGEERLWHRLVWYSFFLSLLPASSFLLPPSFFLLPPSSFLLPHWFQGGFKAVSRPVSC